MLSSKTHIYTIPEVVFIFRSHIFGFLADCSSLFGTAFVQKQVGFCYPPHYLWGKILVRYSYGTST